MSVYLDVKEAWMRQDAKEMKRIATEKFHPNAPLLQESVPADFVYSLLIIASEHIEMRRRHERIIETLSLPLIPTGLNPKLN